MSLQDCELCAEDCIQEFVFEEEKSRSNRYLAYTGVTFCGKTVIYTHVILLVNYEKSAKLAASRKWA